MTRGFTITKHVHFRRERGSRNVMKEGEAPKTKPPGLVPRISRLMALAIHMEELVRNRSWRDVTATGRGFWRRVA